MTLIVQEQLFGTGELVSSAEEGFLHSLEANEMKGVTTPLSSTTRIMGLLSDIHE